jgi:hypothetical protein
MPCGWPNRAGRSPGWMSSAVALARARSAAAAAAVAVGGTLAMAFHTDIDVTAARERGFDPEDFVLLEQMRAAVGDGWQVLTDERRERQISGGSGAHHTADWVLTARRR